LQFLQFKGDTMSDTYKIIRFYASDEHDNCVVQAGLTLEQVQAHCRKPETSSSTCTDELGLDRTKRLGDWFDGYAKE